MRTISEVFLAFSLSAIVSLTSFGPASAIPLPAASAPRSVMPCMCNIATLIDVTTDITAGIATIVDTSQVRPRLPQASRIK